MKKYLVTLFSEKELENIKKYYNNWERNSMLDISKNLELYNMT
jgi:hypothetical protein